MDRRQGIAAIALIGLAAGAALWFAIGGRGSRSAPPPAVTEDSEKRAPEAPPPAPTATPPTLAAPPAKAAGGATGQSVDVPVKAVVLVVTVTSSSDGKPIAGARVRAWTEGQSTLAADCGAEGTARLAGAAPGTWTVRADAEGFAGEEQVIDTAGVSDWDIQITLTRGVGFDGVVLGAWDEKPVADAEIAVAAHGSVGGFVSMSTRAPYDNTRTDAGGRFHVRGIPEGHVATVEVRAKGFSDGSLSVRALGGAVTPTPVLVRLEPAGRIVGVVRDPKGAPVAGATVYVMRAFEKELRKNPRVSTWSSDGSHSEAKQATTDASGSYVVDGLPLDVEYVAVAEAAGFAWSEEATGLLVHRSRLEAEANLALRATAVVVVRLVDMKGAPVTERATVMLGGPMDGHRVTVPDDGNVYRFPDMSPREWAVSVDSPSYLPASATVTVESGQTKEIEVRLDPGSFVEGLVVDEEGHPVAQAIVDVAPVEENPHVEMYDFLIGSRTVRSDEKGAFAVRGILPKESFVEARHLPQPGNLPQSKTRGPLRVNPSASGVRLVLVRLGSAVVRLLTPGGAPYVGSAYVWRGGGGSGEKTEDGRFRFDGLAGGEIEVRVVAEGYAPFRRTIAARLGKEIDLGDVTLDLGLRAAGRVTDLAGAAIPGARVTPGDLGEFAADEKGTFALEHLAAGPVRVRAEADAFLSAEIDVDVRPGLAPLVIRLARGALVRGKVKGADEKPVDDARLVAILLGADGKPVENGPREWDASKPDGAVHWRLPPGRWQIAWGIKRGEEYAEVPLGEWTLSEGETKDLELILPAR